MLDPFGVGEWCFVRAFLMVGGVEVVRMDFICNKIITGQIQNIKIMKRENVFIKYNV